VAKIHTVQTNFSSGEIDPAMRLRVDAGSYANGARTLTNVVIRNTGGVDRRPGFVHMADLGAATRIERFQFDDDEIYVFAFQDTVLKVYNTAGTLLQTLSSASWTAAQLFQITFASLGDVTYVFHPEFRPQKITRTSLSTFTLGNLDFDRSLGSLEKIYWPWYKFAADSLAIKASHVSGAGRTITANAAVFSASHVGSRIRIFGTEISVTGFTSSTVVTGTIRGKIKGALDPDPYRTVKGSKIITVTHVDHGLSDGDVVTFSGSNDVGGIPSTEIDGAQTLNVLNVNEYTFTVTTTNATSSVDGGGVSVSFSAADVYTRSWDEAAYSAVRGWPACGCFHGNRLYLAGGYDLPAALFGSKIGRFTNFDLGEAASTDAIATIIGSDKVVSIRHLVSGKHLQVFTDAGEYFIPEPQESPITPLNISAKKQSSFGIARINPFVFDGASIFVQKSKKAVREFIWSDQERAYAANPLSVTATHLLTDPVDMAIVTGTTERPEQYAVVVNSDGTIALFHSLRVERLAGWTRWTTDGLFTSVTTVDNELWAVVYRRGAYRLEQLDTTGYVTVDSAHTASGAASATWAAPARFTDNVHVVSRRTIGTDVCYSFGELAVAGGNVVLPAAVDNVILGDAYYLEVETLPPAIQSDKGSLIGEKKRIAKANVALSDTMHLVVAINGGTPEALLARNTTDDISLPPDAITAFREFTGLGYAAEPTIVFTQTEPMPASIHGVVQKVSV
jgi:hypothetical protein